MIFSKNSGAEPMPKNPLICFLKYLIEEHFNETGSGLSKRIIKNFDEEISNFVQVCPKEMIDKLKNPISLNSNIKEVS